MLKAVALFVAGALLTTTTTLVPPGMGEAGRRAAEERRYCDASAIFVHLHGLTHDPLALYRGAETAFAAGDYLAAIRLYRTLLDNHQGFERKAVVESRVDELLARVRDSGPGTACALPPRICGDWIVSAGEGCDDGNIIDGDGCDATCMPTGCGNGQRTADEVCDDGNTINGDGCDNNCTASACGNGAIGPGEACDDGNTVDGDGCDSNCTISVCGNGVRAAGEGCDDGNLENGDGCDSFCAVEPPKKPFPVLPVVGGVAGIVVGAVGVVVGTQPLRDHENAQRDIAAAADLAPANPNVALERATAAQQRQNEAAAAWGTWGLASVVAGSVVAVAGVAAIVWGLVTYALPDEAPTTTEEASATTTSETSTTTTTEAQP